MYKRAKIYTVTGTSKKDSRCWGYFFEFNDSVHQQIVDNVTDMWEHGYYPYIVVEAYRPGILSIPEVIQWYEFNEDKEQYQKCEPPEGIAFLVDKDGHRIEIVSFGL